MIHGGSKGDRDPFNVAANGLPRVGNGRSGGGVVPTGRNREEEQQNGRNLRRRARGGDEGDSGERR
jgi:hypothetical protein